MLSCANAGVGLMACHSHFLCMGHMVCRADFLYAGRVAMYMPTILHVSCMAKIDNTHEQWLLANITTYVQFTMCISNLFLKV